MIKCTIFTYFLDNIKTTINNFKYILLEKNIPCEIVFLDGIFIV